MENVQLKRTNSPKQPCRNLSFRPFFDQSEPLSAKKGTVCKFADNCQKCCEPIWQFTIYNCKILLVRVEMDTQEQCPDSIQELVKISIMNSAAVKRLLFILEPTFTLKVVRRMFTSSNTAFTKIAQSISSCASWN